MHKTYHTLLSCLCSVVPASAEVPRVEDGNCTRPVLLGFVDRHLHHVAADLDTECSIAVNVCGGGGLADDLEIGGRVEGAGHVLRRRSCASCWIRHASRLRRRSLVSRTSVEALAPASSTPHRMNNASVAARMRSMSTYTRSCSGDVELFEHGWFAPVGCQSLRSLQRSIETRGRK